MKKRTTPEDDYRRLEERIWARGRGKIRNRTDFYAVYEGYMKDSSSRTDHKLRSKVFGLMKKRHPEVKDKRVIKADRMELFEKAGEKPSPKEFDKIGLQKGRRVYARRTKYKRRTNTGFSEVTVYRDKKGRFVKIKK